MMRVFGLIFILLCCVHSNGAAQLAQTPLIVEGRYPSYGIATAVDGEFAAIGSRCKVHVFRNQNNEWLHIDTLPNQDECKNSLESGLLNDFGYSVALEGDLLVIGAPGFPAQSSIGVGGRVYTYMWNGVEWLDIGILQDDDPGPGDYFGRDIDLDDKRLLIAAPGRAYPDEGPGFVYVYERREAEWAQVAKVTASDVLTFGRQVALYDDHFVVSASVLAPGEGGPSSESVAYVFDKNNELWTEKTVLKATNEGDALIISFVDAHKDRIAVGANVFGSRALPGAVYIYSTENDQWKEEARINPTDSNAKYGRGPVVLKDDYLIASRIGSDCFSGAVDIYRKEAGAWVFFEVLESGDPERTTYYGGSVDYDGQHLIIGAPGDGDGDCRRGPILGEATIVSLESQPTEVRNEKIYTGRENFSSSAYPNPSPSNITFKLEINQPGYIEIEIFDSIGRKMAVVSKNYYTAGVFEESWDGNEFAEGVYFYRINHNRSSKTGKFVLKK